MTTRMIDGGDFYHGRITEDEIRGEAFQELKRIVFTWDRPAPSWPNGTVFTEPRKERQWSSLTSWAILPTGERYELLLDGRYEDERDPRELPPVIWSIKVDAYGAVYAYPRIAQMEVTLDPPYPPDDARVLAASRGAPLGLQERYPVGRLSRGLVEDVRTVSDGWRFRT